MNDCISSDHLPMRIVLKCDIDDNSYNVPQYDCVPRVQWNIATDKHLNDYYVKTNHMFDNIAIPTEALACMDCTCVTHFYDIDNFYNSIVTSLQLGVKMCIPSKVLKHSNEIVGWNDCVKEQHFIARKAFLSWQSDGKPRHGLIYEEMKLTRSRFKYALRFNM